ncbi:MAG: HAD family hydrolase [Pseudomonadales bacterium]|nr:HAD family hydrolase [Pseudomonadales bacterium]MBO6594982.1 HAD family hydrolase [Pseudomonadales bacterium]
MIRMIALDLDGTLAIENHQVSPATRDALRELHDGNDVEVVIATGRRYRSTRYVIDNLGFEVYAVCNGGALLKCPDQNTLHADTFDVAPVAAIVRDLDLTLFAQRDAHDLGGADFVLDAEASWNDVTARYYHNNSDHSAKADLMNHAPDFLVSGVFGTEDEINRVADAVSAEIGDRFNMITVPHLETDYFYGEISQKHVDKWYGLTKLRNHLDIEPDHICTVGDQLNDMPMVSAAGHGIAMSNGHEDLQAIATFVCGHNREDGILDVVNYIHEINAQSL